MEQQEDTTLQMARDTLHKGRIENEEEEKANHSRGRKKGQKEQGQRHGTCGECGQWVIKQGMKRIASKSGQLIFVCPDCYKPSETPKKSKYTKQVSKNKKMDFDYEVIDDVIKAADHYKECLSCCGLNFHMIGNATVKCSQCGSTFRFSKGI